MLRVVLDTNIFVSSLLVKSGLPASIIDAWRNREFLLIISPAIMAEITNTLSYPRIRRKYKITDHYVADLIDLLEHEAMVVPGASDTSGAVPDDPDDEAVLACAMDGGADVIVSGDQHLLALHPFERIQILNAREFMEWLEQRR